MDGTAAKQKETEQLGKHVGELLPGANVQINVQSTFVDNRSIKQKTYVDNRNASHHHGTNIHGATDTTINIGAVTPSTDQIKTERKKENETPELDRLKEEDLQKYYSVKSGIEKINSHIESLKDVLVEVVGINKNVSERHPTINEESLEEYLATQVTDKTGYDPKKSHNYRDILTSEPTTFENIHDKGDYVMMLGEAGSGKTTISKRYCKKASKTCIPGMKQISIVLRLELKDVKSTKPILLQNFIFGNAGRKFTEQEKKDMLEFISRNETSVLIVLDGFFMEDEE